MGRGSELAIGLILALAGTQARCASEPYFIDPANCRAPTLDREVELSLCEADDVRFENRIRTLWGSQGSEARDRAIELLELVWRLDPSLGHGLPMKALNRDDFRAVVAEFLAQSIRSGMSNAPLSDLQKFAESFLKSHRDDDRTSSAVETAGVTDSLSLLPLVIQTIESNGGGARHVAMLALGNFCSTEAQNFLAAVLSPGNSYSDEDRRVARLAIRQRTEGPPSRWCKRGLPATTREKVF